MLIQDGWKSRTVYPTEAIEAARQRKRAVVRIQASIRGCLCRHDMTRSYIFYWVVPALQGIVRGYLLRNLHPLGRYFTQQLPLYMQSWKRCQASAHINAKLAWQRKNAAMQVQSTKKKNVATFQALDRVQERMEDFAKHPLQHLSKVERQLKFAHAAKLRKQQKELAAERRRRGEWVEAAPTMSLASRSSVRGSGGGGGGSARKAHRKKLHRIVHRKTSTSVSPNKRVRIEGTAYTLSDQQLALDQVQEEQMEANTEIDALMLELRILQEKFDSDDRVVKAECELRTDQAHRTVSDRQLRHELAVSQLKVVYDAQMKVRKGGEGGEKVNPFERTLRMEYDSCSVENYKKIKGGGGGENNEGWCGAGLFGENS